MFFKQNIFTSFLEYEFLEDFHYIKKQNNIFVTLIYFQQHYITKNTVQPIQLHKIGYDIRSSLNDVVNHFWTEMMNFHGQFVVLAPAPVSRQGSHI